MVKLHNVVKIFLGELHMKKTAFYILLFILISVFLSACSYSYNDEQLDALSRLDPLEFLTTNREVFEMEQTKVDLDKLSFPQPVQKVEREDFLLTQYYGCSEPVCVSLSYVTKAQKNKVDGIAYSVSCVQTDLPGYLSVSADCIDDLPAFITQIRKDMITLYGKNYRENFYHYKDQYSSFEELFSE